MFRWYRNAAKCYAYFGDVSTFTYNFDDKSTWNRLFGRVAGLPVAGLSKSLWFRYQSNFSPERNCVLGIEGFWSGLFTILRGFPLRPFKEVIYLVLVSISEWYKSRSVR